MYVCRSKLIKILSFRLLKNQNKTGKPEICSPANEMVSGSKRRLNNINNVLLTRKPQHVHISYLEPANTHVKHYNNKTALAYIHIHIICTHICNIQLLVIQVIVSLV